MILFVWNDCTKSVAASHCLLTLFFFRIVFWGLLNKSGNVFQPMNWFTIDGTVLRSSEVNTITIIK